MGARYGFEGAGAGGRARQLGRVVREDGGRWVAVPAGVAHQVRCSEWVRSVGAWYVANVAPVLEIGRVG